MARFLDNARIGRVHGQAFELGGRKVITMYHPAAALRNPALKDAMLADFANLGSIINKLSPTPQELPATSDTAIPPEKKEEESGPLEQLTLF